MTDARAREATAGAHVGGCESLLVCACGSLLAFDFFVFWHVRGGAAAAAAVAPVIAAGSISTVCQAWKPVWQTTGAQRAL